MNDYPSVDSNEPDTIAIPLLEKGWIQEQRPYGDYGFYSVSKAEVTIERKTWSDLRNSLADGRLNEQLFRCLSSVDTVILLVEGWSTSTHDGYLRVGKDITKWRWDQVQNYLLSAQQAGVRIYHTTNETETVRCLLSLQAYFEKEHRQSLLRVPQMVPKSDSWRAVNMMASVDGIDLELGRRILSHFTTLRRVFEATEKELRLVEGIGQVRAKNIRNILDQVWKE